MSKFFCTLATPTRGLFIDEVAYAEVPGAEGSFGVKAGHELILSTHKKGGILTLWLDEAGNDKRQFAVYEGASYMDGQRLHCLARFGCPVEDIDVEHVKARKAELEAAIVEIEKQGDEVHKSVLEVKQDHLGWCEARLAIAAGTLK